MNRLFNIIKTAFPYCVFVLIMEITVLLSWIGHYPSKYKVAAVFMIPYVAILIFSCIPFSRKIMDKLLQIIKRGIQILISKIKNQNWIKNGIFILANLVVFVGLIIFMTPRKALFIYVIFFLVSFFVIYKDLLIEKVEIAVFLVILSVGAVYALTLPVSCGISWDDESHFRSAVMISHIFDGRMSDADMDVLNQFAVTALEHDLYTVETHSEWVNYINQRYEDGAWVLAGRMKPTSSRWCYLPAALGLFIGRVFSLPYSTMFVLGRFLNLLAYAILVYLAIKKIKSGKMILASVALLPQCIFMAASYSRDPWMIGFIMLGFAYLIGEIQTPDKKLSMLDMCIIIGSFYIGISPKAIYVPIILSALCMPKTKFKNEKQSRIYRVCVVVAALLLLASFAFPFISSGGGGVQDSRGGAEVSAGSQTQFILSEPMKYADILLTFIGDYISLENAQMNFSHMHYLGMGQYSLLIMILLAVVTFTDREECDKHIRATLKITTLVMGFGAICLAATAMYIAFTPYMHPTILGCQYRYMIQIMFPTLFVLGCFPIENKIPKVYYRGVILGVYSFVLLSNVWNLCISTFNL